MRRTVDRSLDALLEVGDQISRVAAEDLIASLATENNLELATGQPRYHVLRDGTRSCRREIEVVDHCLKVSNKVVLLDLDLEQRESLSLGDKTGVPTLVVGVTFGEPASKSAKSFWTPLGRHR